MFYCIVIYDINSKHICFLRLLTNLCRALPWLGQGPLEDSTEWQHFQENSRNFFVNCQKAWRIRNPVYTKGHHDQKPQVLLFSAIQTVSAMTFHLITVSYCSDSRSHPLSGSFPDCIRWLLIWRKSRTFVDVVEDHLKKFIQQALSIAVHYCFPNVFPLVEISSWVVIKTLRFCHTSWVGKFLPGVQLLHKSH